MDVRVDEGGSEDATRSGRRLDPRDHSVDDGDRHALAGGEAPFDVRLSARPFLQKSVTRPPPLLGRRDVCREQVVQDGHPDGEPGTDLFEDQRVRRVGDTPVDLDAAVDRARMHDLLPRPDTRRRDPPARGVLAQARDVRRLHPLALHPQHVDDVGPRDGADLVRRLAAERLDAAREEGRRPDEGHVRADERRAPG